MYFRSTVLYGTLLLLILAIDFSISQDASPATMQVFSTITTTLTLSSPKITRTVTSTVTTYGVPSDFTYDVRPLSPSPTQQSALTAQNTTPISTTPPILSTLTTSTLPTRPPSNHTIPTIPHSLQNTHASPKLIGLLFATGAILAIFTSILFVLARRRYTARQQKRIRDWVEMSGDRDHFSMYTHPGTSVIPQETEGGEEEGRMAACESGVAAGEMRRGVWSGIVLPEGRGAARAPPSYLMSVPQMAVLKGSAL